MVRRLNFGCGLEVTQGWVNFDVIEAPGVITPEVERREVKQSAYEIERHGRVYERLFDQRTWSIPLEDGSIDLAVANHSLCAIEHLLVPHWLGELARVLAPGGVLRILVPDIVAAFRAYERGDVAWFPTLNTPGVDAALTAYLTWWSENRSVFTVPSLVALVQDAGLIASTGPAKHSMSEDPAIYALDSRLEESIIVEGIKH